MSFVNGETELIITSSNAFGKSWATFVSTLAMNDFVGYIILVAWINYTNHEKPCLDQPDLSLLDWSDLTRDLHTIGWNYLIIKISQTIPPKNTSRLPNKETIFAILFQCFIVSSACKNLYPLSITILGQRCRICINELI